jgi:hypothetical protein
MMIGTYSRGFVVRGTVSYKGIKELSVESCVFWNIATYNPVKVIQHFRGTSHSNLQIQRADQGRNQYEAGSMFLQNVS